MRPVRFNRFSIYRRALPFSHNLLKATTCFLLLLFSIPHLPEMPPTVRSIATDTCEEIPLPASKYPVSSKSDMMPRFETLESPLQGQKIRMGDKNKLVVPDEPIIPFIRGDGTGPDIWNATRIALDAAVSKAYGGKRKIQWFEVLAGESSFNSVGSWLPDDTIEAFKYYLVGLKGPLTTPIGGGIRSLNVALRQKLDLYVCLRPVRHFEGVPSPVKHPDDVDMVVFRENTEDIYAGIEWNAGTPEARKLISFLQEEMGVHSIRFPETSSIGIKPVSIEGTERLVRAAIKYALENDRKSVDLMHKGNIMKFTEGGFRDWGYAVAKREFRGDIVTEHEKWILSNRENYPDLDIVGNARMVDPGYDLMTESQQSEKRSEVEDTLKLWDTHGNGKWKSKLLIRDTIADITLQQVLTRPREFDVIATMNLNGDYLSDALAAQVGGIGIAPGANINYRDGHAIFEATHGTAPKYANLDKVNPTAMILSGELMLRYLGWSEAADLLTNGICRTISSRTVTYDLHRLMDDGKLVSCSGFAHEIVKNMEA